MDNIFHQFKKRKHGNHTYIQCFSVSLAFVNAYNFIDNNDLLQEELRAFIKVTDGCYYDKKEGCYYVISHLWVAMMLLVGNEESKKILIGSLDKLSEKLTKKPPKVKDVTNDYGNMLDKVEVYTISEKEKKFLNTIKDQVIEKDFESEYGISQKVYNLILENSDGFLYFDKETSIDDFYTKIWNEYRVNRRDVKQCLNEKGFILPNGLLNKNSIDSRIGVNKDSKYVVLTINGVVNFLMALHDNKIIPNRIVPKIR